MRTLNGIVSFLLSLLIGVCLPPTAQTSKERCYDTGNFTTNSTYGRNRDQILASNFPANVSANGGFFSATIGQDSNKVYAVGLCRGEASSDICYSCINSSMHKLIATCPNQKEGISWGICMPCMVRYADRRILGLLELEPTDAGYNTGDIQSISANLTKFDLAWESLMDSVVKKASMGSTTLKYATGEAYVTTFVKIYALMQCSPDLSQKNCDSCLRQSAIYYQGCCHGKQGGYVQKPSCLFRWDLYPFYVSNASTSATAPISSSPPLSPAVSPSTNTTITRGDGGISSQTLTAIVAPIVVIFVSVAIIIAVALVLKRRKKTRQQDVNSKLFLDLNLFLQILKV
ncbi:hypothetical protein CCACVL1_04053 [Corchorus capsularis]|uniref:Gnk2-homologous domain-containing protein n=1 Tax=Corchorus capsularis TaxID=210143 RepID=A0A1R3JVH4_COCAP|nr:hypothetical protein CCACVL1_04053 [Corchorus capsularis]